MSKPSPPTPPTPCRQVAEDGDGALGGEPGGAGSEGWAPNLIGAASLQEEDERGTSVSLRRGKVALCRPDPDSVGTPASDVWPADCETQVSRLLSRRVCGVQTSARARKTSLSSGEARSYTFVFILPDLAFISYLYLSLRPYVLEI